MKIIDAPSVTPNATDVYAARRPITFAYYLSFVALGLTVASLGPTLFRLAENTGTAIHQISFLFTARALGYMLGSLLGGQLYDRVPGHPVMSLTVLLMAVGLAAVPLTSVFWSLALLLLAVGIVDGVTDVGGNILLVWLHGDQVGPFMNALHFFFGVGAFLSPLIIAQALTWADDITWGYWAIALLTCPISIWLFRLPSPIAPDKQDNESAQPANKQFIGLLAALFFLFVAVEVSIGGWIAPYATATRVYDEAQAAYLTAAFWGALTVGRLLSIPLALRFASQTMMLVDLLGCLLSVVLILVWPQSLLAIWVGTLGIGLSLASLFPMSIALAEQHMTVTGRITGLFLVGGACGSMSIPWIIGQFFEIIGPSVVMWISFVVVIIAISIFFTLVYQVRRVKHGLKAF